MVLSILQNSRCEKVTDSVSECMIDGVEMTSWEPDIGGLIPTPYLTITAILTVGIWSRQGVLTK